MKGVKTLKAKAHFFIGILIGTVIGYFLFSPLSVETAKNFIGIRPTPTISVEILKDSFDGYNIHIRTTNFKWAPEHVGGPDVAGEGHAHIYVNGIKIARTYSDWLHIGASKLKEGENIVAVTLNANNHIDLARDGRLISDTVTIVK